MMKLSSYVKSLNKFYNLSMLCSKEFHNKSIDIPKSYTSTINRSFNSICKIKIYHKTSYFFCNSKTPTNTQDHDVKIFVNKFGSISEFMQFFQKNKSNLNLTKRISLLRRLYEKFIRQKNLTLQQSSMLTKQIQILLQQLQGYVQQIPVYGLLVGNREDMKKNIFEIIVTISHEKFIELINKNKKLQSMAKNDKLVKILLQNFQLYNLTEWSSLIFFLRVFHSENIKYMNLIQKKAISTEKTIAFNNFNANQLIHYFLNISKLDSEKAIFSPQTIQTYISKIMSNKQQIQLNFMEKFRISVSAYNLKFNKKDLIQYYNLHEYLLNKDKIDLKNFYQFGNIVRFMSSQCNQQNEIDPINKQLREKVIRYLQFCKSCGKQKDFLLKDYQNFKIIIIMTKINYFNPELVKIIDDVAIKYLQNTPMPILEKLIRVRETLYGKIMTDKKTKLIFQKQNLTYLNFLQIFFTKLNNIKKFKNKELLKLIKISQTIPYESKIIVKIQKELGKINWK